MFLHMDAKSCKVQSNYYKSEIKRSDKCFEYFIINLCLGLADKELCTFYDTETKKFSRNQKEEKYAKRDGEFIKRCIEKRVVHDLCELLHKYALFFRGNIPFLC